MTWTAGTPRSVPEPPLAALNSASRAYIAALTEFRRHELSYEMLRRELAEFSPVPLHLIISLPMRNRIDFFPELVLNLCQGGARERYLAGDIIRTLPKTDVEQCVVADLGALVAGMDADKVAQLSDLLIELGLAAAVQGVASYAAALPDPEMQRLAEDLDGVEHDKSRWRLNRTEHIRRSE